MIAFAPETLFRQNPAVIETEVEGEIVLLHPANWDYFEFNRSGTAIWHLLAKPRRLSEIVAALAKIFDIGPARCSRDISPLLMEMVRKGVVLTA